MNLINGIRNYVLDDEFQIRVFKDKVNILNYKDIGHFDSDKVVVNYIDGSLVIKGDNLVVSRLMNDEILICGYIKSLELR
ncbi:MAG: YabP/YqfC family sporulation protein [Clostridium sp.]|nr:YabP/YqfC family sporulation protein [Clostridium sp.]MCM1444451.1 YabP/YqfC family sporulation protein [Candidatus Amulumruptor caecigallinarius]